MLSPATNMTYRDAIQFLYDLQLFGAKFGLENTRRLARLAGDPQDRLRFVHVAGTNGKGSVCGMLESICRSAGLRTGLFTSPHLTHFGERIRVNNELLSESTTVELVGRMQSLLAKGVERGWWPAAEIGIPGATHPTFFEVVTVMALIHFEQRGCDLALWETGLGGRLDATNIVRPLLSVITNVSLEHAAYLGDTLEKIAAEKSGIIKPGIPCITGETNPSVRRILEAVAFSRQTHLLPFQPEDPDAMADELFAVGYQRKNARLAAAAIRGLRRHIAVPPDAVRTGLGRFQLSGRLQRIDFRGKPLLIDGAHNPGGIRALRESLTGKWSILFGCLKEKDLKAILTELLPLAEKLVLVPLQSPRAATPETLCELTKELDPVLPVAVCSSLEQGLDQLAGESPALVAGSLYLVGEVLSLVQSIEAQSSSESGLNDWTAATR